MKLPLLVALLIASVALAACGGGKAERADVSYSCPATPGKKISSRDELIKAKVEVAGSLPNVDVVDLRCTDRAGLLRIDADLKNDGRQERRIAYRFRWLDQNGMRATEDESWKPLLIYGKTIYTVTTTAPSQDASDFRLVIRDQDQ